MGYQLNKKLADLEAYEPISGEYKIRLDANESCYNLPNEMINEFAQAIKDLAFNRYPDAYAKAVTEAFSAYYKIDSSLVTAGNGSDELISIILACFLDKGDSIAVVSPDFSMYSFYAQLYELDVKVYQKSDDLSIDTASLLSFCCENNVKSLIFSNPCNPTSIGIPKDEIHNLLNSFNGLLILDEAYMDFWNQSLINDTSAYDNLIVLRTCSKAIGIAAARLGFAVSNAKITNALKAAKSPYNTDTISQLAGKILFSHPDYLNDTTQKIISNTKKLYHAMLNLQSEYGVFIKIYNTNANFVFIKTDYADLIYKSLLKNSIAIRKFNGYLRISAGTESEIDALTDALKMILKSIPHDAFKSINKTAKDGE